MSKKRSTKPKPPCPKCPHCQGDLSLKLLMQWLGSRRSETKAKSSRANGAQGGRPAGRESYQIVPMDKVFKEAGTEKISFSPNDVVYEIHQISSARLVRSQWKLSHPGKDAGIFRKSDGHLMKNR